MAHYDLVIIGTGSGNSLPGPEFDHWKIAIVENNLFGGTCLNVGCIPSKMYEYPAEIVDGLRSAPALGVAGHIDEVNWQEIRDRIFARIDSIEAGGRDYRKSSECPNIDVYEGTGRFVGDKRLTVALHAGGHADITADRYVLAAGSRAVTPDIAGLDTVTSHTSDTIMRIDSLPQRLVVLGGGFIAAEFGHIFASLGTDVTQIIRGQRLLRHHDTDISRRFTDVVSQRYDLQTESSITSVRRADSYDEAVGGPILVTVAGPGDTTQTIETDALLLATGRQPNGDELAVTETGVQLDEHGYVRVDATQRTTVDGIWALGDISSSYQLKHVANHEARVVAHNLAHPDEPIQADHRFVPAAVFTHPQIATAGLSEDEARRTGVPYVTAQRDYGGTAAGWAREDTTGFCKLLADPATGHLLGVHIIGPEAATIIQPALTAMQFDIAAHDLARGQYWIHPALPEILENALLELPAPKAQ